ncbi:MAG: ATP-binding protein [Nitrospira sp.]|nr:ATP-binding protein [Nitrospira sp.]
MPSHLQDIDKIPPSLCALLDAITRFASEVGTIPDLGTLGGRIIQELCGISSATQGALFLLDREHECYRRTNTVGSIDSAQPPSSIIAEHPLPDSLRATHRIITRDNSPASAHALDSTDASLSTALEALHATYAVPHINKGRLIAFSLLDAPQLSPEKSELTTSLLAALAQIATNALDTMILSEDLQRSQLLMKRTDRLKSLETIAGGFAHEIRNPLTSIKTFIQLAPERKDDPEFIREFSKIVLDDVYRIERLIQEILDYARYMEPKLTDEDFNDIVASCLYFIDVKADSRGIKIEKILSPELPRVMLDRQQIKQVLLNLLLNAIDAMGERGGRLRVQTRKLTKPNGQVWAHVEIEDTGEGIQEANLEHIFDPFFTTKHESGEHEGTGLGLTIVHQIIQEHHGEIRVTSLIGVGTTFFVSLPALPS